MGDAADFRIAPDLIGAGLFPLAYFLERFQRPIESDFIAVLGGASDVDIDS